MAIESVRVGWLELFTQMRSPTGFLTRLFKPNPGSMNGIAGDDSGADKVAIDIQRYGEDVAIVVTKCTGPNLNDFETLTTKEFTPPAYSEGIALDVCSLLNRMAGVDPFSAASERFSAQLVSKMARGFNLLDYKITRAVQIQAAQILQTGFLLLTDENGDVLYTLDFQPKATHFPTSAIPWGSAGEDPLGDLSSLNDVVIADGQVEPNMLIMGSVAFANFQKNADVQALLDNRRITIGEIAPQFAGSGAVLRSSSIWIGSSEFSIWTYAETYKDPVSGLPTPYVEPTRVILLSSSTRLDMTSAAVPPPISIDPAVENLLPTGLLSEDLGFNYTPNIWLSEDHEQVKGKLSARPLLIPVQIDGYGCLQTS